MGTETENKGTDNRKRWGVLLVLCIVCILINLVGVRIALGLKLPIYLDSIGTILAAALGGYVPGIIVGFATNLINGISDTSTLYYGVLNVLIAIVAAWIFDNERLKIWKKAVCSVVFFSLIGGGLGSILTWFLYGFDFGSEISAPVAIKIYESTFLNKYCSEFLADVGLDLLDKVVCVAIVFLILRILPETLREHMRFYGWRQAPLSKEDRKAARKNHSRSVSLRTKVLLLIAMVTLLIGVVVAGISYILFHNAHIEEQSTLGYGVANVVASNIDAERVDEFLELGEAAPGYTQIRESLSEILNSSPDIEFVYVYRILEDGCHVVFDPDTPEEKGAEAGDVIPFDPSFLPMLPALLAGEKIDPVVSNDSYGWLLTIYLPVMDQNGVCQCYAGVDISMEQMANFERIFLTRVISLFLGFFILILAVGVWLAEYSIILPINSMAMAARAFAYDTEEARTDTTHRIKELQIHTGDEIENLYDALIKTSDDTCRYIADAQEKNDTISKLQNGMIMVLADLVESRDECTGNHVRNTALYAKIIVEQMKKEGIYADQLTEEFMFDVVSSAPLHDVGKIHVPDAILNKPGKLTDEEFTIMKEHAAAGGEIIAKAMDLVSEVDSGYLKEAKNLAACHHEKWNGTGYPRGLSGEEIPLSARIMAVADVFDALVSKRSYKEGFPFEKAMGIIKEGSGNHFDPNVVRAFVDAEEEVRKVAEGDKE
ncbi:MAG: HD domain-containing protein [Blautia sp.]|nr:HD domain-containing protein [Blautia sp.]